MSTLKKIFLVVRNIPYGETPEDDILGIYASEEEARAESTEYTHIVGWEVKF